MEELEVGLRVVGEAWLEFAEYLVASVSLEKRDEREDLLVSRKVGLV